MTHKGNNLIAGIMEQLNSEGTEGFRQVLQILLNEAMCIEREQALGAVA
jgi:hypothetical protein